MKTKQFTLALLILALIQFGGIGSALATVVSNGGPLKQSDLIHKLCMFQAHTHLDKCLDDSGYEECGLVDEDDMVSIDECVDMYATCRSKASNIYKHCIAISKKPIKKYPPKKNPLPTDEEVVIQ